MKYLKLYNTLTKQKEEVAPLNPGEPVRMYTCGPTVYDFAHIGNFRTYLFEDLLRQTLQYLGFSVIQVMNITDIDDKTIKGAKEKGVTLAEFTSPYTQAFFEDLKTLEIEPAEYYPKATDYIEEMIQIILSLQEKGFAYVGKEGSMYFSIQAFESYGKLSHLNLKELKTGASNRIMQDEYDKENASDFVLWKSYDPERDGKVYWESPFGKGRPGWHLECSTMALKILGDTLDIHCGGVDNIFPHHENEIAQSECHTGKPFARIWAHSQHLQVENKKMAKSLGNFYTLRDLLKKGYSPREIRYVLLQTHYRTPLNFTFQELDAVRKALQRLSDFIFRLQKEEGGEDLSEGIAFIEEKKQEFSSALQDDLNISKALGALFDMVRGGNVFLDEAQLGEKGRQAFLQTLQEMDKVLKILPFTEEKIPNEIVTLGKKREEARKTKNWKESDRLRELLDKKGYFIEDTPEGFRLKKK